MTAAGEPRPRALITGGARRVGRAIGLALAKAGCDIDLTYRTSADDAQRTVTAVQDAGADACASTLDLENLEAVEAFAQQYGPAHSGKRTLDIVVHNASLYAPSALEEVSAELAQKLYRVNALAPLLLTHWVAPALRASPTRGGGAVVAMCDIHAMGRPRKGFSAYSMSKAALVELVRSLARDLAPEVRVNGVAPGVVAFPEQGYESQPEAQKRYLSRVPLGRSGTPEDAAQVVRFLALDATYTTGHIIRVDGGRWLS